MQTNQVFHNTERNTETWHDYLLNINDQRIFAAVHSAVHKNQAICKDSLH